MHMDWWRILIEWWFLLDYSNFMHIEYANMSISQRVYELIKGHPKRDESYILDSKNLEIIYIICLWFITASAQLKAL